MFSVSASPFNSAARSLYGGWNPTDQALDPSSTIFNLQALYSKDGPSTYRDAKWAELALKYAADPLTRARAKRIKAAQKKMLATWKKDLVWKDAYYKAIKAIRNPYKRQSVPAETKAKLWQLFLETPWDADLPAKSKAAIAALSDGPFTGEPNITNLAPEVAKMLTTGATIPIDIDPALKYTPAWAKIAKGDQSKFVTAFRQIYPEETAAIVNDVDLVPLMIEKGWIKT